MLTTIARLADPVAATQPTEVSFVCKHERLLVTVTLGLFVLLGLWYSMVVPPFETPDEIYHYAFARHLAQGNPLPVQRPDVKGPWEQEGSQAPLYYIVVGWLTSPIDQSDFAAISTLNPRANIGDPLFPGNKNRMLYSAAAHPLQGANLALHIGRWFSLFLGALTLWYTYSTAKLAFPRSSALPFLSLLLVASIPQFAFISTSFSNDNMIIAASAAVVYWLARLLAKPADERLPWWEWLVLGVLLGLAALSKLQGLGLFLLSALAVLLLAWARRDWLLPLRVCLPVALPAVALAGWWYWRNYTLYGDWSGLNNLLDKNGLRNNPLTLWGFWQEFRGLRYSFWGLFGWFSILLPNPVYTLLDGVTLLALVGLVWRWLAPSIGQAKPIASHTLLTNSMMRVRLLLLVWAGLSFALIFYWISKATGSQGRLLFPAIGAFAILLLLGLERWLAYLPQRWRFSLFYALPGLLVACSLLTLLLLLPASYAAPKPLQQLPATAKPVDVVYGDQAKITLVALETPTGRFKPGDDVPVTLYLRADQKISDDYQLFIQLLDDQRNAVGNLTAHPGWGRNPTTLWQPGALYADAYLVRIDKAIDEHSPLMAQVYIGFIDPKTEKTGRLPVPARTKTGAKLEPPFLAQVTITPARWPTLDGVRVQSVGAQFGQVIQLSRYDQPREISAATTNTFTVSILWDAINTPATDYTAFVHLLGADGKPVTSFDRAPAGERFPTSLWRKGDRILSEYALALPKALRPGDYAVWVGLYETKSGGTLRLPVTEKAGHKTGDGEVLLGKVVVR
ncbi:MAG: DUF2142 domain-containing protein [Caldilineaceae bacterium]